MKHYRKDTKFVSLLTVHVPSAEALIDMLRYDSCCPATEDEAHKIMRMITSWRADGDPADVKPIDHVIRLRRFAANDLPATDRRWRSFGCRVLDERSPQAEPLTDEEALNLAKVIR